MKNQKCTFVVLSLIFYLILIGQAFSQDEFLTGFWALDGDLKDSSNSGHHGKGIHEYTFVDGYSGQAVDFGIKGRGHVIVGYFDMAPEHKATITMWINWRGPHGNCQHLFTQRGRGWKREKLNFNFGIHQSNNKFFLNGINENGETWWANFLGESIPISTNVWHHIAVVLTKDTATLYVDGKTYDDWQNVDTFRFGINKEVKVAIGGDFSGIIDEVRLYSAALNKRDILKIMNGKSIKQISKEGKKKD